MKSRILKKVLIYFLLILLLFALLIGLLFFRLGQKSINEASLKMAESRAKNIAASLTSFLYSDPFIDLAPNNDNETESGNVGQDSSQEIKDQIQVEEIRVLIQNRAKGKARAVCRILRREQSTGFSGRSNRQNPQEDSNRSDSQGKAIDRTLKLRAIDNTKSLKAKVIVLSLG